MLFTLRSEKKDKHPVRSDTAYKLNISKQSGDVKD
nr:MAG TPA: hypothetical protein [Caudoviricetes sp.]